MDAKLYKAYISNHDNLGIQFITISAETTKDGKIEMVLLILDDIHGLQSWSGRIGDPVEKAEFDNFIEQLKKDLPQALFAPAEMNYILPIVKTAIQNKKPQELQLEKWNHILYCKPDPKDGEFLIVLNNLQKEVDQNYLTLLLISPALFVTHTIFQTWEFRAVRDQDVSTEVAYIPISDYTPERAIKLWVTPKYCEVLGQRLFNCAYVLYRLGHTEPAKVCLAVIRSLKTAVPPLVQNPFLITLAEQSIRLAKRTHR